jgi:hypothetical protein
MPSSAPCRSRTARVPRSIVSSSPALVAVAAGAVLSRDAGATGESPRQQGIRRFVGGDANLSVAEAGAATGEVGSDTGEERSTASPAFVGRDLDAAKILPLANVLATSSASFETQPSETPRVQPARGTFTNPGPPD